MTISFRRASKHVDVKLRAFFEARSIPGDFSYRRVPSKSYSDNGFGMSENGWRNFLRALVKEVIDRPEYGPIAVDLALTRYTHDKALSSARYQIAKRLRESTRPVQEE